MLWQILTIARNTFVESVRQPIYFILITLAGIAQVFTTWTAAYSMGMTESGEVSGDDKMQFDLGMATVFVCGMLLAAFLATSVISKEIDRKTVLTVVSKPVARMTVVLGKYIGVAGAILIAVLTMLLFLQMGIRHKVMSTAADELDGPVLVFTTAALLISVAAGTWCNYFYGWSFTQVCTMLLFPMMVVAYIGILLVAKDWKIQPISTDFKRQIALASFTMICAQLVLTAVATAASARLGQVMTIVVCAGVFMLGLLSNYFIGSRAIDNDFVAKILSAEPQLVGMRSLSAPSDAYLVKLEFDPRIQIPVGASFYYGPNPSGWQLAVRPFPKFTGDAADQNQISDRSKPATLVVSASNGRELTVTRAGADGSIGGGDIVIRPPQPGDFIFLRPTRIRAGALALWSAFPNFQYFWLVDAVSQNQPIPISHVALVLVYAVCLVGVFLSLAVALFQTREVG